MKTTHHFFCISREKDSYVLFSISMKKDAFIDCLFYQKWGFITIHLPSFKCFYQIVLTKYSLKNVKFKNDIKIKLHACHIGCSCMEATMQCGCGWLWIELVKGSFLMTLKQYEPSDHHFIWDGSNSLWAIKIAIKWMLVTITNKISTPRNEIPTPHN